MGHLLATQTIDRVLTSCSRIEGGGQDDRSIDNYNSLTGLALSSSTTSISAGRSSDR